MDDPVTIRAGALATPRAYQFDEVFALDDDGPVRAAGSDSGKTEEEIATARQEGYVLGLEEGRREAAVDSTAQLAASIARLSEGLQVMTQNAAAQHREREQEAVHFALAAARKLASSLISRQPLAELEALLLGCLSDLREAPHLIIRICPEHAEELRERLTAIGREAGFAGQIAVHSDPVIMPGDGRIDWADGGIVRCRDAIEQTLDEAVARFFAAGEDVAADEDEDNG